MLEQDTYFRWVWITNFKRQGKFRSRLRKWANQDSSGTTKRADSRWLSSRDSEHEFQADYDRRSIHKLNEMIETQKRRNLSCSSRRRTTSTTTTSSRTIIGTKSGSSWASSEKSQWDGRIESISRLYIRYNFKRKLIEDRDTILELIGKIQELQNEIYCMNDSRDFKDAESVRSGQSHVTSQPAFFTPHPDLGGMLSRSLGMPSRKNGPPSIWDTHGISGNVFANPTASSSAPYPQESNPWISNVSEHTSPHVMSESQTPVQDKRCQLGPSARNSVVPREGRFSNNYGADQQRLQISDPHFDKFATSSTFACWKIRFKTEVCTCTQFLTEAMLWIKEVEMVESVDDLKSSCSERGIQMPNFEVLDAKIASALNRIIHNTRFKEKGQSGGIKGPEAGPFPSRKTDCLLDLRLLPGHWCQLFCRELCRPIYNCSSKWWYSGIRFKMGPNFVINDENPIWWHLGRIVQFKNTRVWETQDRIGIVQYGDSLEESWTSLSQIEDNGEKKYRAEFTNEEFWGQTLKLWKKRRGQDSGDKTAWTKNSRRLLAMES